jgi:hypothetical protein
MHFAASGLRQTKVWSEKEQTVWNKVNRSAAKCHINLSEEKQLAFTWPLWPYS